MFTFCFFCARLKKTKENSMNVVFIAGVGEKIREWFSGWWGAFISIIPKLLYFLCTLIFQLLDILQLLVRKVAGLDVVYYSSDTILGGAEATKESGDLVLRFIRTIFTGDNAILSNIFWALIILALILLIITTFVAVLRSEYAATDAKSASKGKIIGKAFKAIASFAIVPIVCFFGIYLSNIILQALDTITSGSSSSEVGGATYTVTDESGNTTTYNISNLFQQYTTATDQKTYIAYNFWGSNEKVNVATTSTPISGLIFKASAYKANRIRNSTIFQNHLSETNVSAGVFNNFGQQYSRAANLLDECYANSYSLKTAASLGSNDDFNKSFLYPFGDRSSFIGNYAPDSIQSFDKNDVKQVWFYYDLWSFNFVICIGALVIAAKLLIYLTFGLMKRIFELVVLFLIAAPISSLMPLDDGAALKKWREKFTSKVIAAYGPIVGLNLFFVILPFITEINFFNIPFVDSIVSMLFVIVGLIMVKDLCGTISEFIGGDDSLKGGEGMSGEVGGTLSKIGQVAAMPAGLALKGSKLAFKGVKGATNKVSSMRDKHRQKEAENEAALGSMDEDQKGYYDKLSSRGQKRVLRSMRSKMSQEQKDEARLKYEEKDENHLAISPTRIRKAYNRSQINRELNKVAKLTAQEEIGGKEAWHNISKAERKARQNVARERIDLSPIKINNSKENIDNLNKEIEGHDKNISNFDSQIADFNSQISSYDSQIDAIKTASASSKLGGTSKSTANYEIKKLEAQKATVQSKKTKVESERAEAVSKKEAAEKEIENEKQSIASQAKYNAAKSIADLDRAGGYLKNSGMSAADAAATGKKIANAFKDALSSDNLSPIFNALGANLAKGFKDAGGFKAIENRMHGYSGKEEKISDELKTQKRILGAQDQASKLLGRGGGGPSQVELDDKTIKKLADAITNSIPKK